MSINLTEVLKVAGLSNAVGLTINAHRAMFFSECDFALSVITRVKQPLAPTGNNAHPNFQAERNEVGAALWSHVDTCRRGEPSPPSLADTHPWHDNVMDGRGKAYLLRKKNGPLATDETHSK